MRKEVNVPIWVNGNSAQCDLIDGKVIAYVYASDGGDASEGNKAFTASDLTYLAERMFDIEEVARSLKNRG